MEIMDDVEIKLGSGYIDEAAKNFLKFTNA